MSQPSKQSNKIVMPYKHLPRDYQVPLWQFMFAPQERFDKETHTMAKGKRAIAVWHRRAGKDFSAINICATKMMERVGLYWHLLPTYKQGRKIIWDGFTSDGRKIIDAAFPQEIRAGVPRNDLMQIRLKNGSIYQVVGTDDIDSLVGSNPVGVIFSEYSIQNPAAWDLIRPILSENGGWAMFIYTARGRNHGYDLIQRAKKAGWFTQILTVDMTKKELLDEKGEVMYDDDNKKIWVPVISREVIQEDRDTGMPEELIQQEYWNSFDASLVGSYYGQAMAEARIQDRLCRMPHDPTLLVHTAWDIGVGDATSIVFLQIPKNGNFHIIDYIECHSKGFAYYAKELKKKAQELHYDYGTHLAPHDMKNREISTAMSRLETAKQLGIKFEVVPKLSIDDGIDAVRGILPKCFFDYGETEDEGNKDHYVGKANQLVNALSQYSKVWDSEKKIFQDKPKHDWSSHPCDAFRVLAVGKTLIKNIRRDELKTQTTAITDYNMFQHEGGQSAITDYNI
jgi:hypothetical protein